MNDDNRSPVQVDDRAVTRLRSKWQQLSTRNRRVILAIAGVLALALLAWLLTPKSTRTPAGRFGAGGPMPIAAAAAQSGSMPIILNGLGTVTPRATVTVQSQISGQIVVISFKEGQTVKKGDPLILIDPRPYQVALEQADGALARDQALLENAKTDLARYQTLFAQDSIAEQQLATQRATVAQDQGLVKTDRAAIDSAKLNLVYCHIVSPIDGRAGLQLVTLGNYVTPAEPNGLLVITQLKPITVVFPLPQDQIPAILDQIQAGRTLSVSAYDRTHTTLLANGVLETIDNQIDTTTGTVKLKANFPNEDERLFPNQFVNVDLLLNTLQGATLIPQAAIQRGAPGTYVYVVNADKTVSVRKVTLGPGDAINASVKAGIAPGELVVVDGADRLKDGAPVLLRQGGAAPGSAPPSQSQQQNPDQHQHRRGSQGAPAAQSTQAPSH